jgi:hypothetical protein
MDEGERAFAGYSLTYHIQMHRRHAQAFGVAADW